MFNAYPSTSVSQKNQKEYNQNLLYAICDYDMAEMMRAIKQGADLDTIDTVDDADKIINPPLIKAITTGNLPALKILLKHGAKVTATSTNDIPAFIGAVSKGYFEMVHEMLLYKANPNVYHGCTALQAAIVDLSSLPVIRYSHWSDAGIKEKLLAWYHQKGEFAVSGSDSLAGVPFPEPTTPLRASYKGMLEIIALLLNEGVKPWIGNDSNVNVLDILADPVKYKKYFCGNLVTFLESADKDTLTFKVKLTNRNNSSPKLEVIVDYDLKEVKNRIETYMKFSATHGGVDLKTLTEDFQGKIADHLKDERTKTTMQMEQHLTAAQLTLSTEVKNIKESVNFERRAATEDFVKRISTHPNAQAAYKSFKIGLEAIHISALAVKGGGVTVSDGSFSLVASALDMSTELVDMIPVIGSAVSKFFGLASVAAKEIDATRQTNLFENIAAMATAKEARKIFESVARKLTLAYFQQFERLATKEIAQAQMSRTQQGLQNAKGKVLNNRFKAPTEQVTAFAIIWMMDEVFNNAHKLDDKELTEKGLETLLLNAVTQHTPPEKLTKFWNEITAKLGINAIPTQTPSGATSGETWHPADFWTAPGVMVQNSQTNGAVQYFAGNNTNAAKFGWRLGSLEDVAALGLRPTTEAALLLQPASPTTSTPPTTVTPPSPTVMYAYSNTPASPVNSNTTCSSSSSTQALKPQLKPDNPPAPKRNRSPFGRLRACLATS